MAPPTCVDATRRQHLSLEGDEPLVFIDNTKHGSGYQVGARACHVIRHITRARTPSGDNRDASWTAALVCARVGRSGDVVSRSRRARRSDRTGPRGVGVVLWRALFAQPVVQVPPGVVGARRDRTAVRRSTNTTCKSATTSSSILAVLRSCRRS